jgi:predicted Zn-dependent protease
MNCFGPCLPPSDDPRLRAYVGCVAQALVDVLPDPQGSWSIAVFADQTPNAFALPGGKIGIHAGMLNVARADGRGLRCEAP